VGLLDLASRIAGHDLAEVTLCWGPSHQRSEATESVREASANLLRDKGLTVFVDPTCACELRNILLVDASRSIDLIIMREHEELETANRNTSASVQVVRRLQRPVIACGPFFMQNQGANKSQGPILAAVSMRESSEQISDAAGRMGKLIGTSPMIIHVVDVEHTPSRPDSWTGIDCDCQMLGNWISKHEASATAKLTYGPIAETLTRFATQVNASMIVMGVDLAEEGSSAQHSDTLRRNVLMAAPCPVLFVPTFHSATQAAVNSFEETSAREQEQSAYSHPV
jgi:hypothetical protein